MPSDDLSRILRQNAASAFAVPAPIPLTPLLSLPKSQLNPAEWMYERLVKRIVAFEAELSQDEEIGARLVATPGPDGILHVEDVSYWGPDMIMFVGQNQHGRPVELIQHYSQLNLLLTALPKQTEEPRRIGFMLEQHLSANEAKE